MSVPESNEYNCGFCKTQRSMIYTWEGDHQVASNIFASNSEYRPCERCTLPVIIRYLSLRPTVKEAKP